jgi:YcxB-like protein
MVDEPEKSSNAPIRIRYVESADSLIEAIEQMPPASASFSRGNRWQLGLILVVALLLPLLSIAKRGGIDWKGLAVSLIPLLLVIGFGLVIFFVLQKGPRLLLSRNYYRKSYRKQTGREQSDSVAEFGAEALFVSGESGAAVHIPWRTIHRIVERPKGLLVYETDTILRWFPRSAFASEADYAAAVELMRSKVSKFEHIA